MIEIIPAILATTQEEFERYWQKLQASSSFFKGWVHIDFMDNIFVQNQSVGVETAAKFPIVLNMEAHLMVQDPKEWVDKLAEAKFKRVVVHVESNNARECISYAKSKGLEVGVAIKHETPISDLQQLIPQVDFVHVMSVSPGFQGHEFIPDSVAKIKEIKQSYPDLTISVDGGIDDGSIKDIVSSGADRIVIGSYFMKGEDIDENLEKLWEALNK